MRIELAVNLLTYCKYLNVLKLLLTFEDGHQQKPAYLFTDVADYNSSISSIPDTAFYYGKRNAFQWY